MGFGRERAFFAEYRAGMLGDQGVSTAVVGAIGEVLSRYNTVVWENRFIVGGVVEQVLGASARALGIDVLNAGKRNQGYDLELPGEVPAGISVKGVFASTGGKHNLVNVRNTGGKITLTDCHKKWSRATMFVMAGVGIGYADREMNADLLSPSSDAVQISGRGLKEWWREHPAWVIELAIPAKQSGPAVRVASDAVSMDVLADFPALTDFFIPEI